MSAFALDDKGHQYAQPPLPRYPVGHLKAGVSVDARDMARARPHGLSVNGHGHPQKRTMLKSRAGGDGILP
jgi:hypothetical protein